MRKPQSPRSLCVPTRCLYRTGCLGGSQCQGSEGCLAKRQGLSHYITGTHLLIMLLDSLCMAAESIQEHDKQVVMRACSKHALGGLRTASPGPSMLSKHWQQPSLATVSCVHLSAPHDAGCVPL